MLGLRRHSPPGALRVPGNKRSSYFFYTRYCLVEETQICYQFNSPWYFLFLYIPLSLGIITIYLSHSFVKRSFFQAAVVSILLYGCTIWTLTKRLEKKNAASNFEQVLEATPNKAPTIRPPTSHHENYQS